MPFDSNQVDPTHYSTGRYYSTDEGLAREADRRIGDQVERALNRLAEGDHERYVDLVNVYRAQGFTDDVADAKALDEVYGDASWRNFRK